MKYQIPLLPLDLEIVAELSCLLPLPLPERFVPECGVTPAGTARRELDSGCEAAVDVPMFGTFLSDLLLYLK